MGGPAQAAAALLIALAAFLFVVGGAPLAPSNIAWLSESDAATNYLGWAFFRDSPWAWPPAANPAYGMDIAGSILMADANPLLAMPFKLLSPLLPEPFQYFGWWLLVCFLLQGLFAQGIAARITPHAEQRLAIVALFLFAPCFLIRIATPATFHMTLCGQWQILAAFWLYLSPDLRRRAGGWAALLTVAVLTHPYLLAMVAAIWIADLLRSLLAGQEPPAVILRGAALAMGVPLAIGWASGVFWLARPAGGAIATMKVEWGFGIYRMNLLSPFDPQGWSWLLPDLPSRPEEIEGFAYLGFGVLLLAAAAVLLSRRAWGAARLRIAHVPLVLALLGFAAFAATPYLAIGLHVTKLPWPEPMIGLGNLFRSSGRFAWPLVYIAMAGICWVVTQGASRRTASILLAAAALVQIGDGSAGWRGYAQTFARSGPVWPTQLSSPFWDQAGRRYKAVRLAAPRNRLPAYRDIAAWAHAHGMATDVVYLARYDGAAFDRMAQRRAQELRTGRLERDTLWIMDGVPADVAARMPRRAEDVIQTIDGVRLFAPDFGQRRMATSALARSARR